MIREKWKKKKGKKNQVSGIDLKSKHRFHYHSSLIETNKNTFSSILQILFFHDSSRKMALNYFYLSRQSWLKQR